MDSYSFSGLFGTGVKDVPPKRIATTTLSSSSTVKRSSTNDQIAPIINTQENPADGSISERFDFIRAGRVKPFLESSRVRVSFKKVRVKSSRVMNVSESSRVELRYFSYCFITCLFL